MKYKSNIPNGYKVTGFGLTKNVSNKQDYPEENQIKLCSEWLRLFTKKNRSINFKTFSYTLKHKVEDWSGKYISNGAIIEAAYRHDYKIRAIDNGPNAYFGMDLLFPEDEWMRIRPIGFSKWLFLQLDRDDYIKKLASHASQDTTWPRRSKKFIEFWMYLQSCKVTESSMDNLTKAWEECFHIVPPAPNQYICKKRDGFYNEETDTIKYGDNYQSAPQNMAFIYVLYEPETDVKPRRVKYVGRSKVPAKRLKQHITQPGSQEKVLWAAKFIKNKSYPCLGIIDVVCDNEAVRFEKSYIYAFDEYERKYGASLGDALLNKLLV